MVGQWVETVEGRPDIVSVLSGLEIPGDLVNLAEVKPEKAGSHHQKELSENPTVDLGDGKLEELKVVRDLLKDDLLSKLRWKSSRRRRSRSPVHKVQYAVNDRGPLELSMCRLFRATLAEDPVGVQKIANQRQSMALVHQNKKNRAMKTKGMQLPGPSLASIESLAIPLVQEVVFLADFRCAKCQQRVAEVMAKMNGETDSVVVSVLEKKVTLTCRYPAAAAKERASALQLASTYWISFAPIRRLFLSTCR